MRADFAGILLGLGLIGGLTACQSAQTPSTPTPYIVFFTGQSVEFSAAGRAIVDKAARDAKGASMVQIAGPSTKIAANYNPGLAEPRIKLVENELQSKGIAAEKLVRTSLTTEDVMVDTSGAQRVEIRIIP